MLTMYYGLFFAVSVLFAWNAEKRGDLMSQIVGVTAAGIMGFFFLFGLGWNVAEYFGFGELK